ncbi:ATP-binding protein [Streptomyces sp. DT24]|uniref:ATP-binding protein n=1 Tax=unclassified Streptomyces TaxID=2593676 RepID=UPI003CE6D84E
MTTPTSLYVSSIRLAAVTTAANVSRAFIRQTLLRWQLADFIDGAELIVSELVTNAVKETGIIEPSPSWEMVRAHHILGVQIRLVNDNLYVEVWDRGDGEPAIPEQTNDAESGRGLFLVDVLSEKWGVHRPAVGGKIVWAKLPLDKPLDVPLLTEGLPQRDPGTHGPVAGEELKLVDKALVQRVLDGLRQLSESELRGYLTWCRGDVRHHGRL